MKLILCILGCLILPTTSKFLPPHPKNLNISSQTVFASKNGDVMDDLYYKFVEKIIPYLIVFDDFDSLIHHLGIKSERVCEFCVPYYKRIQKKLLGDEKVHKDMIGIAYDVCQDIIHNASECGGIIGMMGEIVVQSFMNHTFDYKFQCGYQFGCLNFNLSNLTEYQEQVWKNQPPVVEAKPTLRKTYQIAQMTDFHFSYDYQQGANIKCNQSTCCTTKDSLTNITENQAGYWGTLANCDIPYRTVEEIMKYVGNNFSPDILLLSGDYIGHSLWYQERDTQLNQTKDIARLTKQYFNLSKTAVYPIVGNHEDFPVNEFDYFGNNSNYLTEGMAEIWTNFLDDQAINSVNQTGFYSMNNTQHNLKIINLQTSAYNLENFYLWQNPTDPYNQCLKLNFKLEWLRNELQEAENNNQTVYIQAHIPIYQSSEQWAQRFIALVERYQNIIRGQFCGHTHTDQLSVLNSNKTGQPIGFQIISPSITTYGNINPAFRIFEIDEDTNMIITIKTYRLNISKANENITAPIEFELTYDFAETYNIPYLSNTYIQSIVDSFLDFNSTNLQSYLQLYQGDFSPKTPISELQKNIVSWWGRYCEVKNAIMYYQNKCFEKYPETTKGEFGTLISNEYTSIWYSVDS